MDNQNKPKVSILMPTFNVEKYVNEAVSSILNQTYNNIELIIVDDCSTDGTFAILQKLALTDSRILLAKNEENMKICATLNKAWRMSTGEYIARMDGDDVSEPQRLEILMHFIEEHPNVDLVGSQVISIDEEGSILSYKQYLRSSKYIDKGNRIAPCVSHIWLAKRKVYDELKGYRNIPFVEDYDFLLRGQARGFNYANVDEYLYRVRIRQGNTGSTNGLPQRKAKFFVQNINSSSVRESNIAEQYEKAISCSEDESREYSKAHDDLEIAIHSRKKPWRLLYFTIKAMIESKYVRSYLIDSLKIRSLLWKENMEMPRKPVIENEGNKAR